MEAARRIEDGVPPQVPPKGDGAGWNPFRQPPRLLFHLALVPPAMAILWNASLPGVSFNLWIVSTAVVAVEALVWVIRLVGSIVVKRRSGRISFRLSPWYLVAPLVGLVVLGLASSTAPLRMRWALAKPAFEQAARQAPAPTARTEWVDFDVAGLVGSYKIESAARVGDGLIFYHANGAFFDDAGFAFLPTGPFPELESGSFENPHFYPLGGGWYAWTASW